MTSQGDFDLSAGPRHLLGCLPLFIIGAMLLTNLDEDPTVFGLGAMLFLVPAAYLLIVGAVARGIQVAHRAPDTDAGTGLG